MRILFKVLGAKILATRSYHAADILNLSQGMKTGQDSRSRAGFVDVEMRICPGLVIGPGKIQGDGTLFPRPLVCHCRVDTTREYFSLGL